MYHCHSVRCRLSVRYRKVLAWRESTLQLHTSPNTPRFILCLKAEKGCVTPAKRRTLSPLTASNDPSTAYQPRHRSKVADPPAAGRLLLYDTPLHCASRSARDFFLRPDGSKPALARGTSSADIIHASSAAAGPKKSTIGFDLNTSYVVSASGDRTSEDCNGGRKGHASQCGTPCTRLPLQDLTQRCLPGLRWIAANSSVLCGDSSLVPETAGSNCGGERGGGAGAVSAAAADIGPSSIFTTPPIPAGCGGRAVNIAGEQAAACVLAPGARLPHAQLPRSASNGISSRPDAYSVHVAAARLDGFQPRKLSFDHPIESEERQFNSAGAAGGSTDDDVDDGSSQYGMSFQFDLAIGGCWASKRGSDDLEGFGALSSSSSTAQPKSGVGSRYFTQLHASL